MSNSISHKGPNELECYLVNIITSLLEFQIIASCKSGNQMIGGMIGDN